MLTYFQAIVIGLLQGVTELFPISSLGHTVLLPKILGWNNLVAAQSQGESFFLAFVVGLHVATALALIVYFRREWVRIVGGFFSSVRKRRIETPDERLFWLLVVATIPAGVLGLALEHTLRTVFAKPIAAAAFLMLNGVILLVGEQVRKGAEARGLARVDGGGGTGPEKGRRLDTLDFKEAGVVGLAQSLALFAGISRSGTTMVAGLARGLNHEDAARFTFLMATPIILAAGVYKIPDLMGHNGDGIRGQVLVGSMAAAIAAYISVRFLTRYFETRTLRPFGIYCLLVGAACVIGFGLF